MPAQPHIVIGANYGDEGKGLMVDYLVRTNDASIVVRHNGGAQAGHTVVLPDGRRHVCQHFGAGTLAGAATYLSEHFVSNPILFVQELAKLQALGCAPKVHVHAYSVVTTPWDMMLNQAIEKYRVRTTGAGHGSVGVGINETIRRSEYDRHTLYVGDFVNSTSASILDKFRSIINRWVPFRLQEVGVPLESTEAVAIEELCMNENVMFAFFSDCRKFLDNVQIVYSDKEVLSGQTVVFEGAQGLALDQNNKENFPHVTRSNTGVANALRICASAGLDQPRVTYVTRTYLTRHGAGPLPGETIGLSVVDLTNVDHEWQGKLRFAPLDKRAMCRRILLDAMPYASNMLSFDLAVTHTDELEAWVPTAQAMRLAYDSCGPTHEHVKEY